MSDDQARAAALYGNPGGSPGDPGNIGTALGAAFTPLEGAARGERNFELAAEIKEVRATLGKEMLELGFSDASAKEFAGLLGEYYSKPRDAKEQRDANRDKALDELSHEWGADFEARYEGSSRVMAALTRGNPRLLDFIHSTGLSHDVRFTRLLGEVARHRAAMPAGRGRAEEDRRKGPSGNKIAATLYGGKKG